MTFQGKFIERLKSPAIFLITLQDLARKCLLNYILAIDITNGGDLDWW